LETREDFIKCEKSRLIVSRVYDILNTVDVLTSLLLLKKKQSPISPQTDSVGEEQCIKNYRKELTYLQSKPREHSQRRGQYTDSKNHASRFGSFKHTTIKKTKETPT